jgi:hypothetical protein
MTNGATGTGQKVLEILVNLARSGAPIRNAKLATRAIGAQ